MDDQEGDFAAGQEAEHPEEHHKGDFAEGQEDEEQHDKHAHSDFAKGQEEKEHGGEKEHTGTFAEGQDEDQRHEDAEAERTGLEPQVLGAAFVTSSLGCKRVRDVRC